MILQQLMETIDSENPPKPCDYFDMIGGTSTGGQVIITTACGRFTLTNINQAYRYHARAAEDEH
jgi:patatin-like phospholipase/acyl hydrolase